MSEVDDTQDDGRELAATIFDWTAATAITVADLIPDSTIKAALSTGGAIAKVIGKLIRSVGTSNADELIKELVARRDEGIITADGLKIDDASIAKAVADLYEDEDTKS